MLAMTLAQATHSATTWGLMIERVGVPVALLVALLIGLVHPKWGIVTRLANGHLELVAKLSAQLDKVSDRMDLLTVSVSAVSQKTAILVEQHADPQSPFATQRTNFAMRAQAQMIAAGFEALGVERVLLDPFLRDMDRAVTLGTEDKTR